MNAAVKIVFGENQKFVPLVGTRFTQEDVRARQPDTEESHDPNDLDPAMFPAAPAAPPPATREGFAPKVKPPPPGLKIATPTVTLQSAPKAAPVPQEVVAAAASASSSLPSGYGRAYFMEGSLARV